MVTVAAVLKEARQHDPSFTEERHPGGLLRAHLSSYVQELGGIMVRRYRNAIPPVTAVIPLPFAAETFTEGFTLPLVEDEPPEVYRYRYLWLYDQVGDRWPCHLLPEAAMQDPHPFPSLFHRGRTFFPTGMARDWKGYTRLELTYTPIPSRIALDAEEIEWLPSDAHNVLVHRLVRFMAFRAPEADARVRASYHSLWEEAEARFLNRVQDQDELVTSRVREVL